MYTVTLSAGAVFFLGALTGLIVGAIGLVIVAVTMSKKK